MILNLPTHFLIITSYILNWPFAQVPTDGSRDFKLTNVRFGDFVNPGSSNTIDMQWLPPIRKSALVNESVTVRSFGGNPGLDFRVYYLEQAPGAVAYLVPHGQVAVGEVAPPLEKDGDNVQLATIRGKALRYYRTCFGDLCKCISSTVRECRIVLRQTNALLYGFWAIKIRSAE